MQFALWLHLNETIYIWVMCMVTYTQFNFWYLHQTHINSFLFFSHYGFCQPPSSQCITKIQTSVHMICQNKILPTLRIHGIIWLTWKYFGQYSKINKKSCKTNLFISKMNLTYTFLLKFISNDINKPKNCQMTKPKWCKFQCWTSLSKCLMQKISTYKIN
jgi:hypothetical protein